jgi:hypothetical protein
MAPLSLANHLLPHALAALASAESRIQPAGNQPTPATQALALMQKDAAFSKGLVEGFYTEACETFNPVQWFTVAKDFIFCAIEIWGDYHQKHLSIEMILKQRALSPLVHLWDQLLQTAGKLNAEAWGKITGTILFHLIVGLVVGFFTEGVGAVAEGAVVVSRLSQLPRAAQVAIRTAQGAQMLRAFSAGHDPNNPCAGPVIGALTLAVGWAAGKAFGAAFQKGKQWLAARAAARQGELARELPAPQEGMPTPEGPLASEAPQRTPIPGDEDFVGPVPSGGWRLTLPGMGAHLFERANITGRPDLAALNLPETPTYFPSGSPEAAGVAHVRLHQATVRAGIRLGRAGNPHLSDSELIEAYRRAYSDPELNGIRGDLRVPRAGPILAQNVSPAEAFEALLRWLAGQTGGVQ